MKIDPFLCLLFISFILTVLNYQLIAQGCFLKDKLSTYNISLSVVGKAAEYSYYRKHIYTIDKVGGVLEGSYKIKKSQTDFKCSRQTHWERLLNCSHLANDGLF